MYGLFGSTLFLVFLGVCPAIVRLYVERKTVRSKRPRGYFIRLRLIIRFIYTLFIVGLGVPLRDSSFDELARTLCVR